MGCWILHLYTYTYIIIYMSRSNYLLILKHFTYFAALLQPADRLYIVKNSFVIHENTVGTAAHNYTYYAVLCSCCVKLCDQSSNSVTFYEEGHAVSEWLWHTRARIFIQNIIYYTIIILCYIMVAMGIAEFSLTSRIYYYYYNDRIIYCAY